jgi:hypothetical protein
MVKAPSINTEVVWEVEEEEEMTTMLNDAYVDYLVEDKEAIILQNKFRMSGFRQFRVCALGFRKVLM